VLLLCALASDGMAGLVQFGDPVTPSDSQHAAVGRGNARSHPEKPRSVSRDTAPLFAGGANSQVLNRGKAEHRVGLSAIESHPDSLLAYLEAHNECYWIEYPRQCSANAPEPQPVSIKTG
jgi:hypothetical protein